MDIGRTIAASLAAAAMALFSACAAEDSGEDSPEPSAQTSSAAPVDMRKCLTKQRYHTWPSHGRLQNITEGVLSEPDRVPPKAIGRFARDVRRAVEETSKACGDEATALHSLAELVQPTTDTGIDESLLRQIVDAYEAWGREIGRPRETRIVYLADVCAALTEKVRATYEIRRQPESGGYAVSVDLVLVNDWDETVYLDHGGSIDATGVRPDGASRTYQWGGSSADTAGARPGRTSRDRVAPVPATGPEPSPIRIHPEGDIRVYDVYGSAYSSIGPCRIPVEPAE